MSYDVDLVVVGGGPAGSAAAIWARLSGLRVRLFERAPFPRHRPGETLHPGAGAIFRQLGVGVNVEEASKVRHRGHRVSWGGNEYPVDFGASRDGIWLGYQIMRSELDGILLARASNLGVDVCQPRKVERIMMADGRVIGVQAGEDVTARFVVDASGGRSWLSRQIDNPPEAVSPPLRAWYSYCEGEPDPSLELPRLTSDEDGWTWIAKIAPRTFHWTRMNFSSSFAAPRWPQQLAALTPVDRIRGADVTWRRARLAAAPGYFIVGDAAAVLDPASSHGVLRAMMSGIMAAYSAAQIVSGSIDEDKATQAYSKWIATWFQYDLRQLTAFYGELRKPPEWLSSIA